MSLIDIKNILKCLSKCTETVKDEILKLFVEITSSKASESSINNISVECIQYLSFNLQLNPYPTVVLIQQLLCLWNPKFQLIDNTLQDLYIDTLDILVNRLESGYESEFTIAKLCSLLSQLRLTPTKMMEFKSRIIPKLLKMIKNHKISEKYLYLCLLSQYNLQILKQLELHTKSNELLNNSSDIFLKCFQTKQHWLQVMISQGMLSKENVTVEFVEILNFIKLILEADSTNLNLETIDKIDQLLLNIKNIYEVDTFIKDFSLEMHRQILIIKFCLEHSTQKDPNIQSIFEVIRGNSCLSTLSRFIDLSNIHIRNKCLQMLKLNRESQPNIYTVDSKTMVPANWDIILFRGYCIMINLIQCVTTVTSNSEQYFLHVTSVLNETKQEILNLEKFELQIEVIENIFALIFIRYEHFSEDEENDVTKKLSGFVCSDLIVRDILDMLKYCIHEIKCSAQIIDHDLNKRILIIEKYVNEGLSRLYFLTNDSFIQSVGVFSSPQKIDCCRCAESSGTNIEQYYSLEIDTSDSESDVTHDRPKSVLTSIDSQEIVDGNRAIVSRSNSFLSDMNNTSSIDDNIRVTRRRKLASRRSETEKSSEGSETTASSGRSRRRYPKRSSNNEAIRERIFLLNFMLSSPQSLLCLCLAQGDYERVQKVVNMYNLEKTHIASNVLFTKNLQDLRMQLRQVFDKFEPETDNKIMSPEASLMQNIKKVTGSVYDTTQVINMTEQFFSTNLLPENKDSKQIIERFSSVYPFLNNYTFNNELFMHVFDICLTLGTTYDQSVTLLKCACRHTHNFENNSEFSIFYENIKKCHQESNSIYITKSPNISISVMLLSYKYPLNSKHLNRKFTHLKSVKENFQQFLINDLHNQISTPSSLANSSLIKISHNINEYHKIIETKPINYLQRFQNYIILLSRIYEISNINIKSCFDVLQLKRAKIVDKVVFESEINPIELERIFRTTNLDLIFHLIINCFPKIDCQIKNNVHYDFNDYNDLNRILVKLIETINKSDIEIVNIHPPNKQMLDYIQKNNILLLYLLILMYPETNNDYTLEQLNTSIIDNLINLDRIQQLQILYESNKVVAALQNYIEPDLLYKFLLQSDLKTSIKILTSLSERQLKNNINIKNLKDVVAYLTVNDLKSKESYKYVEMIQNITIKCDCVLNNLKYWSGLDCIRILKDLLSNFHQTIDGEMKLALEDLLKKVIMYEDIRTAIEYETWYDVYAKCEKFVLNDKQKVNYEYDPTNILKILFNLNKIDLVINWINAHSIEDCLLHLINGDFIKQVFETEINFKTIETIFNQIPIKLVEEICCVLFKTLRNIHQLQFLIEYITSIDTINPNDYHNIKIGIKLLTLLHPSSNDNVWTIIDQPLLILEQYLMNTKLEKLSCLIKSIKNLLPDTSVDTSLICVNSVDNLLRLYAEKALEFRIRLKSDDSDENSSAVTSNRSMDGSPNHLLQSIDSLNTVCSTAETEIFVMPEQPPKKCDWMQDYDTNVCLCCHETIFSMFNRRHHCRRCGRVVCGNCSRKRLKISIYGDLLVRVCNQCYNLSIEPENFDGNTSAIVDRPESETFVDFWWLTNNTIHNSTMRDEFSFEYAPSVSLCLSILKLHSQNENYTNFLLNQCNSILRMVLSLKVVLYNEIDYNMVFQMLRSLLVAAKVNSARNNYDTKLGSCDQLLGQIDILNLLAANDCLDLLPTNFVNENFKYKKTPLSGMSVRKLRDNLMEHEKWNLAIEISTKTGLDTTGVFAAWGKSCLKAGCFQQAREIFQYCLDKVNDDTIDSEDSEKLSVNRLRHSETRLSNISIGSTSRPQKNPALVNEIIEILESTSCIIDPTVLRNAETTRNYKPPIKSNTSTAVSVGSTDSALHILNKLANLKNISMGNFNTLYSDGSDINATQQQRHSILSRKNSKIQTLKPSQYKLYVDQCIHNECLYYLRTYGSHSGLLEYHLQHHNVRDAVVYLQENKLSSDYYVELYVHCLKSGCVHYLQQIFIDIDSTLDTWKDGLRHICRYLEQNGLLNVLYQIQEWLGDHVRAAMTCIKFYSLNASNYTELLGNLEYLHKAQNHLKYELESDNQWVQVEPVKKYDNSEKSLVLKMNSREIDKHINTIWRQIEITKFLASNEKCGRKTIDTLPEMFHFSNEGSVQIPTLFGSKVEKIQLAVLAITSGENITEGFGIAFRIIQDFQLNSSKIYCIVAKQLAQNYNCNDIEKLVDCIATSGMSEESTSVVCDEVISLSIRTMCTDNMGASCSMAQIESLIKLIHDVNIKITAYIDSKQLKSAYLLAVRNDRIRDIRRILREAERLNQPHIRTICIKRLSQIKDNNSSERNYISE